VTEAIDAAMTALNLGFSTGSAGNRPATDTNEKSHKAKTRATKAQKKTLGEKEKEETRRILKRYNAELRLAHQAYRSLPSDGYDSYGGIWRPPEQKVYYGIDYVFRLVHTSGSRPTEVGVAPPVVADYPLEEPAEASQRLKYAQQGLLDPERSLTQLHKVDVAADSLEATRQEKPPGVCCTILSKDIEIYRKPMPIVSEWFNPGAEHYWHNHFEKIAQRSLGIALWAGPSQPGHCQP
jgi:hypothetical protein